jgi:hypothetical protein
VSILDQADNPRRLVTHDDDSDVSSCAYPYATVLDGIRWWVQRDRLSFPLHGVEDQSRPWGPCVTPASGGEELHLYGTQVIKDLVVSTPHPWHLCHFEGTDRSFALYPAFPDSLGGRDSTDYYGSAAPPVALATYPPTLFPGSQRRFRRCSHSTFSVSLRYPSVTLMTCAQAREAYPQR